MADYSDTEANIPESAPEALNITTAHDEGTDRDSATPDQIAGAHLNKLRSEIAALWDYVKVVAGYL